VPFAQDRRCGAAGDHRGAGVGKSTFIESFGTMLVRKGTEWPCSPSTQQRPQRRQHHGRQDRMERLSTEPGPSSGRLPPGHAGRGSAQDPGDHAGVRAAGYDVIMVETVGVGQSETTVASMVISFWCSSWRGRRRTAGIKKGILELADALAINKADGDNLGLAKKAAKVFESALHLLQPSSPAGRRRCSPAAPWS